VITLKNQLRPFKRLATIHQRHSQTDRQAHTCNQYDKLNRYRGQLKINDKEVEETSVGKPVESRFMKA